MENAIIMTRKKIHVLFVVLTLLSVAVLNQSCLTAMITSSLIKDHKEKSKKNDALKIINDAINKGAMDKGEYTIMNMPKKYDMDEMVSLLESNNYVTVGRCGYLGRIDTIKFVPKNKFYKYYYKLKSGRDFSTAKKAKCCVFSDNRYYTPSVKEVYWSGDVVDGYINGTGVGLDINNLSLSDKTDGANGSFSYFQGVYVYGIPVNPVNVYTIGMEKAGDFYNVSPQKYPKQDANFFLVKHKDKFDEVMLANFSSYNAPLQYEKYKKSANEVKSIVANYKSFAEDIIMNEKTPQLSKNIQVSKGLFGAAIIMVGKNSPEELEKRQKLEAFKNFEGFDMSSIDDKYKELFSLERKALLKDVNQTLEYMDLLDGLALTSEENTQRAINQYNYAADNDRRAEIDESEYWKKISNATNIADKLKNASTGQLREKYAKAKQKLDALDSNISRFREKYYSKREKAASKRADNEKQLSQEIDWSSHKEPSGRLVDAGGIFSSYKQYENDGRIYTKSGRDYCIYNIIFTPNKEVDCYRITYSTKNVDKKDFKSLGELVESFLKAIK